MKIRWKNFFRTQKSQDFWQRKQFVEGILVVFYLVLIGRFMFVHFTSGLGKGEISKTALHQTTRVEVIPAPRGNIIDRNGEVLASDFVVKRVNLDPTLIHDEYIPHLARALQMKESILSKEIAKRRDANRRAWIVRKNLENDHEIIKNLHILKSKNIEICRPNKRFASGFLAKWLAKKEKQAQEKIACKKQKIAGVALQDTNKRFYPKGAEMSALVGKVNFEGDGILGVERAYNSLLKGQAGQRSFHFNKTSKKPYFLPQLEKASVPGSNIQLTIDSHLQHHVFQALKTGVLKRQATAGGALVLSSEGEVLALANYPAGDPNDSKKFHAKNFRNRVLSDQIEPGSTVKPFVFLLALDANVIRGDDQQHFDVSKRFMHLRPDEKYTSMNASLILQKSHNLGTALVGHKLSSEQLYDAWQKLGFGTSLGLLPETEARGLLHHFESWREIDKITLSYGYGPMNTTLGQLARAYLVFANNGKIRDLSLIYGNKNEAKQVFSAQKTSQVAGYLERVVSDQGSGYRAQIPGFRVGGKTGTVEIATAGSYSKKGEKRTLFVGFAPVDDPKYIVAVILDRPKRCFTSWDENLRNRCEGSNSTAIIFQDIMENILRQDEQTYMRAVAKN